MDLNIHYIYTDATTLSYKRYEQFIQLYAI